MGDIHGFKKFERSTPSVESPNERIKHFKEFYNESTEDFKTNQAARCMDCGVPFCHSGCPLGNLIPDFNEAVHKGDWKLAYELLIETNNFPEFTGRICPAPCEASCVLSINKDAVSIEFIEKSIIETAFKNEWVKPDVPLNRTGKVIAIVGSGPAGLAAADQLNSVGHSVTVFEKSAKAGGLLRYGIPDFKLEKSIIDRRIKLMEEAGIVFSLNTEIPIDINQEELLEKFDAILLCGGSSVPRNLNIKGRELKGIHYAMDFLTQNNERVSGIEPKEKEEIKVFAENVVVIGGGDTGSDCIGTSNRLGASSITQIEIMPMPSEGRTDESPWPLWPQILRTSSSHEEGCERSWSILTEEFVSEDGLNLSGIKIVEITWEADDTGNFSFKKIPHSEKIIPCTKVFLAMGFLYPKFESMLEGFGIALDEKKNVHTQAYKTNQEKIFSAGDMRRGQSLVVWAIKEGRDAAIEIDKYLMQEEAKLVQKTRNAFQL